ncbi:MAG: hypothetical protein Q7S10_03845 [bacterium]|nr:hypothetical protein [bacterium]
MNQLRVASVHAASALLLGESWECRCRSCRWAQANKVEPVITDREKFAACLLEINNLGTIVAEEITWQTIQRVDVMSDEEVKLRLQSRAEGGHQFSSAEVTRNKRSKLQSTAKKGRVLREGKTMS